MIRDSTHSRISAAQAISATMQKPTSQCNDPTLENKAASQQDQRYSGRPEVPDVRAGVCKAWYHARCTSSADWLARCICWRAWWSWRRGWWWSWRDCRRRAWCRCTGRTGRRLDRMGLADDRVKWGLARVESGREIGCGSIDLILLNVHGYPARHVRRGVDREPLPAGLREDQVLIGVVGVPVGSASLLRYRCRCRLNRHRRWRGCSNRKHRSFLSVGCTSRNSSSLSPARRRAWRGSRQPRSDW